MQSNSSLLPQLKVHSIFPCDIHIKISVEGFRDKIFDVEMLAALRSALSDEKSSSRYCMMKIAIAALAQGVLHYF